MHFVKMLPWSMLPTQNKHHEATILTPKVQFLFPGKVYNLKLGLGVYDISETQIIKLQEILPGLTILNKFWTPNMDFLMITFITEIHIYLNVGDPICKVCLVDTKSLLPGNTKCPTNIYYY